MYKNNKNLLILHQQVKFYDLTIVFDPKSVLASSVGTIQCIESLLLSLAIGLGYAFAPPLIPFYHSHFYTQGALFSEISGERCSGLVVLYHT